ncbi:MAG: hypothetical protein ACLGQX_07710 [Acidobacteriota bacterium]
MRLSSLSVTLGAALICVLSAGALRAQEQPAAGTPPPGATSQTPPAGAAAPAANVPPPAYGQPGSAQPENVPSPQRQAERQISMLTRRLSLTPEQQSQIEPILANRQHLVATIRHDSTLAPWQKRVKVQKVFRDSDGEIEAILNGPQVQRYQRIVRERLARQRKMQQQQMGASPMG